MSVCVRQIKTLRIITLGILERPKRRTMTTKVNNVAKAHSSSTAEERERGGEAGRERER